MGTGAKEYKAGRTALIGLVAMGQVFVAIQKLKLLFALTQTKHWETQMSPKTDVYVSKVIIFNQALSNRRSSYNHDGLLFCPMSINPECPNQVKKRASYQEAGTQKDQSPK
jgi:hypothetical protein